MNIREIAKIAGVSASTVSKVINGKDKDISEETKKKVFRVIEQTNYVPYQKFREKEHLKSRLLILFVPPDMSMLSDLIQETEREAGRRGYYLIVHYVNQEDEIPLYLEAMETRKPAGILIVSGSYVNTGKLENHTVYLSRIKDYDEHQRTTFYYSVAEAGRLAVERFLREGHQRIACIAEKKDSPVLKGYRDAMRHAGLTVKPSWMYEGSIGKDMERVGFRQCLAENVTAVICGSREIACCLSSYMNQASVPIPDELGVIVIGDDPILDFLGNGFTAVSLPIREVCRSAVSVLTDAIEKEKKLRGSRYFEPELIERGSVIRPPQAKQGERIVVVGGLNMDTILDVSKIPAAGEAQVAERVYQYCGGKGGNQAVGAGMLGGLVYLIGCIGNDMDGRALYSKLLEGHVHADGVIFEDAARSGKAYIHVAGKGDSTIVTYPGANHKLGVAQMNRFRHLFYGARYCLLSMGVTREVIEYTIKYCRRKQVEVILKPSNLDAEKVKEEFFADIAYFVPNEKELDLIVPDFCTLEEKAQKLLDKGVKNVIVTRSSRGCYLRNAEYSRYFEGSGFEAVDTTGGADSFISALAVCLSEGRDLLYSIGFAVYASGLTVTRYGVQGALPDRATVELYEDEIRTKYGLERV